MRISSIHCSSCAVSPEEKSKGYYFKDISFFILYHVQGKFTSYIHGHLCPSSEESGTGDLGQKKEGFLGLKKDQNLLFQWLEKLLNSSKVRSPFNERSIHENSSQTFVCGEKRIISQLSIWEQYKWNNLLFHY